MGTAIVADDAGATESYTKQPHRPEVLFFDSNETMLDLNVMKPSVTKAFGGRDDLMLIWFTTMLQYSLVDTVTNNYHDFGTIGAACMQMVARGHGIKLTEDKAREAVAAIRTIPAHPDVPPGLKKMKDAGFRMYTLTNSPKSVMESQITNSGIVEYFDGLLTIDGLNIYKPHPRTYHWAAHQANVPIRDCMLIAAHGWDVAGARLAGMRAAFIARPGKALYPLGPGVEITGPDMGAVADHLIAMPK
jgi:2-haloacid dehalogenase